MPNRFKTIAILILLVSLGSFISSGFKPGEGNPEREVSSDTNIILANTDITCWLTNPDKSALLQKQNVSLLFNSDVNQFPAIEVDASQVFQEIDGFGIALTGGSASLINKLAPQMRDELLKELFSRKYHHGLNTT